jgi:hypothetical protein
LLKFDLQLLQWVYTALAAPLLGWLGGWMHSRYKAKQTIKAKVDFLSGLPAECKCELLVFKLHRTHTMRGDPGSPPMRLLERMGVVVIGTRGGMFDAVDRYITVSSSYWTTLDEWIRQDAEAVVLMTEIAAEMQSAGSNQ